MRWQSWKTENSSTTTGSAPVVRQRYRPNSRTLAQWFKPCRPPRSKRYSSRIFRRSSEAIYIPPSYATPGKKRRGARRKHVTTAQHSGGEDQGRCPWTPQGGDPLGSPSGGGQGRKGGGLGNQTPDSLYYWRGAVTKSNLGHCALQYNSRGVRGGSSPPGRRRHSSIIHATHAAPTTG